MTGKFRNKWRAKQKRCTNDYQLPSCCASPLFSTIRQVFEIVYLRQFSTITVVFIIYSPILPPLVIPNTNDPAVPHHFLVRKLISTKVLVDDMGSSTFS